MKKTWSSLFEVRPEGKASGHSWEIKKGWKGALLGEEVRRGSSANKFLMDYRQRELQLKM